LYLRLYLTGTLCHNVTFSIVDLATKVINLIENRQGVII